MKRHSSNVNGIIMKRPESCPDECGDPRKIKWSEMERQRI
jgi:hypothetical protein